MGAGGPFTNNKLYSNNFNSIHIGGIGTATSNHTTGLMANSAGAGGLVPINGGVSGGIPLDH